MWEGLLVKRTALLGIAMVAIAGAASAEPRPDTMAETVTGPMPSIIFNAIRAWEK